MVLGRYWHMAADGELHEIAEHEPVLGRSGKVEEVDKKQRFWPSETVLVPGTRQVWSVGVIELGAYGDANFRRGAVLSYDAGQSTRPLPAPPRTGRGERSGPCGVGGPPGDQNETIPVLAEIPPTDPLPRSSTER